MREYPEDIPWKDVAKFAVKCVIVLAAYFVVQTEISCDSIRWMAGEVSK